MRHARLFLLLILVIAFIPSQANAQDARAKPGKLLTLKDFRNLDLSDFKEKNKLALETLLKRLQAAKTSNSSLAEIADRHLDAAMYLSPEDSGQYETRAQHLEQMLEILHRVTDKPDVYLKNLDSSLSYVECVVVLFRTYWIVPGFDQNRRPKPKPFYTDAGLKMISNAIEDVSSASSISAANRDLLELQLRFSLTAYYSMGAYKYDKAVAVLKPFVDRGDELVNTRHGAKLYVSSVLRQSANYLFWSNHYSDVFDLVEDACQKIKKSRLDAISKYIAFSKLRSGQFPPNSARNAERLGTKVWEQYLDLRSDLHSVKGKNASKIAIEGLSLNQSALACKWPKKSKEELFEILESSVTFFKALPKEQQTLSFHNLTRTLVVYSKAAGENTTIKQRNKVKEAQTLIEKAKRNL